MTAMTIDQMVTEDQRNLAMEGLQKIINQTNKVVEMRDEMESMSVEDVFNILIATIAVVRFNAHATLDDVRRIDAMR